MPVSGKIAKWQWFAYWYCWWLSTPFLLIFLQENNFGGSARITIYYHAFQTLSQSVSQFTFTCSLVPPTPFYLFLRLMMTWSTNTSPSRHHQPACSKALFSSPQGRAAGAHTGEKKREETFSHTNHTKGNVINITESKHTCTFLYILTTWNSS